MAHSASPGTPVRICLWNSGLTSKSASGASKRVLRPAEFVIDNLSTRKRSDSKVRGLHRLELHAFLLRRSPSRRRKSSTTKLGLLSYEERLNRVTDKNMER